MSKHTPGPWIGAGPSFGDPLPRYTTEILTEWEDEHEGSETICTLPFAHHDEQNEANALLISAAPDLLEALEAFLRAPSVGSSGPGSATIVVQDFNLRAARAAIAKATGAP
jgi:hypothetical protein